MTDTLIVGYGSIGRRHADVLAGLGRSVGIVSRRVASLAPGETDQAVFHSLDDALADKTADYVVIANETSAHAPALDVLAAAGFSGKVLVEKPLAVSPLTAATAGYSGFAVAYNLRFHPVLLALRDALDGETVLSVSVQTGQHLSQWRTGRDYRESYSAHIEQGGGVLLDLSHELDYLLWLFGACRSVTALGGNAGALGIESDELWSVLMRLERAPVVQLRLSYLDQPARREIIVLTGTRTLVADLIAGTLSIDGEVQTLPGQRNESYSEMHKAMLAGNYGNLCSFNHANEVLRLAEGIRSAANSQKWIDI